jgi:hypothetical protein
MSRRNKKRRYHSSNHPDQVRDLRVSERTKNLGKSTGHGFQEFGSLKDMHTFFTTEPDDLPQSLFEPPMLKKASPAQLARSRGNR